MLGLAGTSGNQISRIYSESDNIWRANTDLLDGMARVNPNDAFDDTFIRALMDTAPEARQAASRPEFTFTSAERQQVVASGGSALTKPIAINFATGSAEMNGFVSSTGQVLGRSEAGAPAGVLTWSEEAGAEDHQPVVEPTVTLLYDPATPHLRPDCDPGRCAILSLREPLCESPHPRTLILSAHGDGQRIGGLEPEELAEALACLEPELVVLDVCYGASAPILSALGEQTGALIVAVPDFLAARGFRYGPDFYQGASPEQRAAAVSTEPPSPLFVGHPDLAALSEAVDWVDGADGDTLRPLVRSWVPTLVGVPLPSGQEVLVAADWRRIGHPPLH